MNLKLFRVATLLLLAIASPPASASAEDSIKPLPPKVECEGHYPGHLQGICLDEHGNIYWSFTTWLVKTDAHGNLLQKIAVANHHGDLCFADGKIYVAVNLGDFNNPAGNADSWVYVYKAKNLDLVAKHEIQQVKYGAGGIATHKGRFIVVGGLPHDLDENYLYEFDAEFKFLKKHVLSSGHTHLGIQGATFAEGKWWFACYGTQLLIATKDFQMEGRFTFDCGYGLAGLGNNRFYVARGNCQKPNGCNGYLLPAKPTTETGLKIIE